MLEQLKPERVFYYFEELTKIPRESGNEKAVSDYLVSVGKKLGYETLQDDIFNVIIKKPSHPDYVGHEPVVLQGHIDMVAEKAVGVNHNFLNDAIPLVVEDGWVKTKGTTLGADNGIAVAITLAILEDKNAKHPELEALFTTNEETTMAGARSVKFEWLKGRKLLNIDTEEEGVLIAGCSGGHNIIAKGELSYEDNPMKNTFELHVSNMLGGHSGMEIHQKRGNSLKFALEAMEKVKNISEYRLISIEGGTKHNAIPRDCKIIFSSNEDSYNIDFSDLIEKYPLDKDMEVTVTKVENSCKVLTFEFQNRIENVIKDIPHGVYSMMKKYPTIVECSDNFAMIRFTDEKVIFTTSLRSSNSTTFDEYTKKVVTVLEDNKFNVELKDYYKPWEFVEKSSLRDLTVDVYKKLTGKEMKVEVVHAALEPAVFIETFPDMEMVSIGPTMKDVHSPTERLNIESTERSYEFVRKILENL